MSQEVLKDFLAHELHQTHSEVVVGDGFVYAQGKFPVLLVAHLDTVHKELPKTFEYDEFSDTLSSPEGIGGDDRCGVYMILEVIKRYNCSVLFCEDEEVGGVGARKFVKAELSNGLWYNYIIEFDRKGSNDAVFYDCNNPEFEEFITREYYRTNFGSFSDISIIAPALGCAAVNLSCGYYNAHTVKEFVAMSEMYKNIERACDILERTTEDDKFEYIDNGSMYDWFGFDTIGYNGSEDQNCYIIEYYDEQYNETAVEVYARSEEEAVGKFCMANYNIPFGNVFSISE
jgi:hypothetical protein